MGRMTIRARNLLRLPTPTRLRTQIHSVIRPRLAALLHMRRSPGKVGTGSTRPTDPVTGRDPGPPDCIQQRSENGVKYRPDIDGLRAVAVVPVLLYHAGLGFPGGFVGVDIFFVLSGYLLSSIVIQEMDAKRFSFLAFY